MSGYCWNEYEHERDAQRDARYGAPDRDHYDRWHESHDPCREVYTEAYDREVRSIERRREEEEQGRLEHRQAERRRMEREAEEESYYSAQWPEEQFPEPEYEQRPVDELI